VEAQSLLFPAGAGIKIMVALAAYFDDSGNSDIAVVAGGIASVPQWERLRRDWDRTIRRWKLKHDYFHLTDCVAGHEGYEDWTDSTKEQRIMQLVHIARKNIRMLLAHAVRRKDFDRVFSMYPNKHFKTPIRFCAYMMAPAVDAWRKKSPRRSSVALLFESGNKLMGEYGKLINSLGGLESFQQKHGICSLSQVSKNEPGAQAADMIAYAVFTCERATPIPQWLGKCFEELFKIKHHGLSFTLEHLELYFKDYARDTLEP